MTSTNTTITPRLQPPDPDEQEEREIAAYENFVNAVMKLSRLNPLIFWSDVHHLADEMIAELLGEEYGKTQN